jgi:hypothetical protein
MSMSTRSSVLAIVGVFRLGRLGRLGLGLLGLGLLGLGLGLAACATPQARPASFRVRPDSVARGDLAGPFSGRVIDSETDRPIPGALVYASWRFVSGSGFVAPDGFRDWIGSTDAQGRYVVPELEDAPGGARLADFHLLVYKRGYVAYRSDRRFDDLGPQTEFSQQGASITMARWRPEFSHAKHLRYVGGGAALAALTAWELPDAVAELSGANPLILAQKAKDAAGTERLDASKLLGAAEVKTMTNFEGAFDTGELGDEPQSEHYDTVHLQARGKDESYDVALRMWRYPPDEAGKQFERLVGDLPGAVVKNEIADKSLRAAAPAGDILGLAFLDAKRGIVVLIQCGASQCRTHETVLGIARIVLNHVETEFQPQSGAAK